jgi:hypothetical protein
VVYCWDKYLSHSSDYMEKQIIPHSFGHLCQNNKY